MKVLMQSRTNFYELRGGDTVQLEKTKSELEKLGVEIDFSLDLTPDLSKYDLIHLSNVTRIQETYMHVKNAKAQRKPIVLSTIFWPMDEFERLGQIGIRKFINTIFSINNQEKIKAFARYVKDKNSRNEATKNLWRVGYTKMQQYVLNNVDYLLPNSEMEMNELSKAFKIDKTEYTVIPNAVDKNIALAQMNATVPEEFKVYENAIICVGRIEPRKNQLSLVKALDNSGYKLLLVGAVSDNHKNYFAEIKRYFKRNPDFHYIPRIDNSLLYQLYKVCKVSVLPSWLDTPGLVNLEAGVMGCNLVVSCKGSTTEYFEGLVEYCLPDDIAGLRKAIDKAYQKEKSNELKDRIINNYTWQIAAQKTLEAYERVLANSKNSSKLDDKLG